VKGVAVRARIRNKQDDPSSATVPHFQEKPPHECLTIGDRRLGLDMAEPLVAHDGPIPGAKIAGDQEGLLRQEAKRWMEHRSQFPKERIVRLVAKGVPVGICLDGQLEAHDGTHRGEDVDRRMIDLSALQPANAGVRDPDSLCDVFQAQAGADPSAADVVGQSAQGDPRLPASAIGRAFT